MAKFFIPLGHRYKVGSSVYSKIDDVHGPFDNDPDLDKAIKEECTEACTEFLILEGQIIKKVPSE
jgi:hypothetical protein